MGVNIYFTITNILACGVIYPSLYQLSKEHEKGSFIFYLSTSFGILFALSSLLTFSLAYAATKSCPTDPIVREQRMYKKHNLEIDFGDRDTKDDMHCNVCNLTVQGRTKHCAPCNRCCAEFDHHCVWLNNCIGSENYNHFRRLIFWFLLFNLFSLSLIAIAGFFGLLGLQNEKIALPLKITIYVQAILAVVVCYFDI